jgi:bifunctional DNA-binding transcriptional regulator/antitoxin component of YhaV-PrlF toxin-antitoxin module
MKLTLIENIQTRRSSKNVLAIKITKHGQIILPEAACNHINVKAGDSIAILQDEGWPDDFYLLPGSKRENLPMIRSLRKSNSTQYITNYAAATKKIMNHFGLEPKTYTIMIGGAVATEHGRVFALITKALRKEASNG